MKASLETKALGLALLAATISLGGALLASVPIKKLSSYETKPSEPTMTVTVEKSPALVAQGRKSFVMSCVECHGDDAHGDEGPDLHNLAISNARISATIKKGVKGEMPSFAKKYDDAQVGEIIAYLRSLH